MSTATVADLMRAMENLAPLETCESFDNCGLMTGHPNDAVQDVFLAMDADIFTVRQAVEQHCQMMITHHPIFFNPARTLRSDEPLGQTVRMLLENRIALYCAHTNFDRCAIGTSRALAAACGADSVEAEAFLAWGDVAPTDTEALAERLRTALPSGSVNVFGRKTVTKVCACAGSGSGELDGVCQSGAQVFVCGELSYHQITDYLQRGIAVITCGHPESEAIALKGLAHHLQNDENLIQYSLRYHVAGVSYQVV